MRESRATFIGPIGIGIGHVVLVFGLLNWLGYPLDSFAGHTHLQFSSLVIGSFLVAFLPVLVFARTRLVVPLGMGTVGLGIAIVAGLSTPHPEFVALGEDLLIVGTSYVGAYANGWYVWLLAYGLGGVCEYAVRTSVENLGDTLKLSARHVRLAGERSMLFGCVVGLAHTVVITILGIRHDGALLSDGLLGWGLFGMFLLGLLPMLFLIRHQLISPLAGLVAIQLVIGIETLTITNGTPVSGYMLFWPVYLLLMLLLVISEYALRWSHRKITVFRHTIQSTNR